jgi:iron complex outermembrane receptor protein
VHALIINAGLSKEFREVGKDYLSPRLGANWLFGPDRMLRASASRSYYVGTLYQQYANFNLVDTAGDPDPPLPYLISTGPGLEAQKMTSYEIGYVQNWQKYGAELDIKLFHEALRDEGFSERVDNPPLDLPIVWGGGGGQWTTKGGEFGLRLRPTSSIALDLGYAYLKVDGRQPKGIDANFDPIDFEDYDDTVPRHTLSTQLSGRLASGFFGTLALYHVDEMRWRGEGDTLDAFTRVDLKLGRTWRLGEQRLDTELIVQNLFDESFTEFNDVNDFERRAYLQFRLQ